MHCNYKGKSTEVFDASLILSNLKKRKKKKENSIYKSLYNFHVMLEQGDEETLVGLKTDINSKKGCLDTQNMERSLT